METRIVAVLSTGCLTEGTIKGLDEIIESTYEEDANPNFTALIPMEGGYLLYLPEFTSSFFPDAEDEGRYEGPSFSPRFESFLNKLIEHGFTYLLLDRDGPTLTIEDIFTLEQ